ncbi:2TM domain-containing protein [Kaistella yonginensis]|uniref:2TM domain-containing protein n=1 Tax=Kaistella yonginensis TaxID=658267 RepID=UPI0025B4076B|nr:2TM domain-containing protein [Kaistella yonginensis]MDN3608092.1 2TM domain-containing protein [Kaistella yonginensis]
MENLTKKEMDFEMAKERVRQLKNFYLSLAVFAVVFAAYSLRKYYLTGEIVLLDQKNVSIIFYIWVIILAIKGAKLFFLNHNWERKMIDKQLKQNNNGNF